MSKKRRQVKAVEICISIYGTRARGLSKSIVCMYLRKCACVLSAATRTCHCSDSCKTPFNEARDIFTQLITIEWETHEDQSESKFNVRNRERTNDIRHLPLTTNHAGQLRPTAIVCAAGAAADRVHVRPLSSSFDHFRIHVNFAPHSTLRSDWSNILGAENSNQNPYAQFLQL